MPDIRYICVSDLHLGADNSLLTHLGSEIGEVSPLRPSRVLVGLVNCLRELVRHNKANVKPTLILNGDLLELALAQDNIALMAFERFIELLFPTSDEQLVDPRIIFNPGNHDHHLWETARETQYVEFLLGKRSRTPDEKLPPPWHTTKMFNPDLVDSCLLNAAIHRHTHLIEKRVHVGTVYPNLCLMNSDESRCVIVSHGHFVESVYMLMTTLGKFAFPRRQMPEQVWDLETENFAWIDFFWSAMGRSGAVGKEIEQLYDMLLVPEARQGLVRELARAGGRLVFHRWPKLGEWLASFSVPFVSKELKHLGGLEKTRPGEVLTDDARQGLKAYMEGPVAKQILEELKKPMQARTTFIFGHTHKPFSDSLDFNHFTGAVSVYNSGGWVVDSADIEPTHGGALVLADEELNVVSVRMYNEVKDQQKLRIKVEAVDAIHNPFYAHVNDIVKSDQDPWLSFSKIVSENLGLYHHRFRDRLNFVRKSQGRDGI